MPQGPLSSLYLTYMPIIEPIMISCYCIPVLRIVGVWKHLYEPGCHSNAGQVSLLLHLILILWEFQTQYPIITEESYIIRGGELANSHTSELQKHFSNLSRHFGKVGLCIMWSCEAGPELKGALRNPAYMFRPTWMVIESLKNVLNTEVSFIQGCF